MAIRNNLDEIVNVDIEIAAPGSGDESFSNILMVVEAPDKTDAKEQIGAKVVGISRAAELEVYGFSDAHQAHIMATVAYSQSPKPGTIYVVVRQEASAGDDEDATGDGETTTENGEAATKDGGVTAYEKMSSVLDRAKEAGGWYGIALSKAFLNAEDIEETVKWTEGNKKLFGFTFVDKELPVSTVNYFRSFAAYGGDVPDVEGQPVENYYISLAMMAKCFGYDPGSETWALKALAAVYPCRLSTAMKKYCDDNRVTYFTTYAKRNITSSMGGRVLGDEWIDTIRFRDWLQNDMQERVFNLLVLNRKLPYTDEGITGVEGKMEESLKEGQKVGGIALTEYDDDGNEIPGYTITVPKSANITDAQKASRQLKGCRFTAKLAGAIQAVDISGSLVYA